MTNKPKSSPAPNPASPQQAIHPKPIPKRTLTDLAIAQELSGDPNPMKFTRTPEDFMTVVISTGQKYHYTPGQVRKAIASLS